MIQSGERCAGYFWFRLVDGLFLEEEDEDYPIKIYPT
jgi:hypothetical protein